MLVLGGPSPRGIAVDALILIGFPVTLVAGGIILYLARNVMPAIRKKAVIVFGIVLAIVQIGDTYVPRTPLTDKATAMGVWIFYTLFVLIAFLVEKIGTRRQTNLS